VAFVIYSKFSDRKNLFYLYDEEDPSSAFILAMGYFTKLLVFGLPVFLTNYYLAHLCFKSRPISYPLVATNILSVFACNALYLVIIFKVIAGETFDYSTVILAITGIAAAFIMEWVRYAISSKTA
jgi:hypothetical protein